MSAPSGPAVALHHRDEGTGPLVLLIHGVGGSHTIWNAVAPDLASGFRLLIPDLRGHGRTPAPAGSTFSVDELLGDLLALVDAAGQGPAHWVGFSGGAMLALRAALDHRDRVKSLTMVSGAAYTDAHTRSITDRFIDTYTRDGPDAYALRLLKDMYYPDWIEAHLDYADELRAGLPTLDLRPATAWTRAIDRYDERNRIGSVTVPTLIVQAMDDVVIDASHGRILRQTIPGSQIRILPQTGHMVPIERPRETAEAIRGFLAAVEAGRSPPRP